MKITNAEGVVEACVKFNFHGHEISASTIFTPHDVYDITTGTHYFSIEEAIDAIIAIEKVQDEISKG